MNPEGPDRISPESETAPVKFFVRTGKWVVVGLIVAIAGLVTTFSADPAIKSLGWYAIYVGTLSAILIFDFLVLFSAMWSWRKARSVAGFLAFAFSIMITLTIVFAFFLDRPQIRDALFFAAIALGLPAPLVQAIQERRQRNREGLRKDGGI